MECILSDTVDTVGYFDESRVMLNDALWPNRFGNSHPLSPDKQTGPSVDWDVYDCLPRQDLWANGTSPFQLLRVHYSDPTQLEWMILNFL